MLSVIEPVGRAWDRMLLICFRPFNLTRWLLLGFCAWLAYLAEGGGGGNGSNFNFPAGRGGRGGGTAPFPVEPENPFTDALTWLSNNALLVISLTALGIVLGLALYLAIHWLRARGEFMFVDGIATNRQDNLVSQPWKQYAKQANSFFVCQAAMHVANIILGLLIALIGLWIAWPDLLAWEFGGRAIAAIITTAITLPITMLLAAIFIACNRLFILPIMYARSTLFAPAFRDFWTTVAPRHIASLILFFAMYILFNIAFAALTLLSMCFTCCIAALPYIGTVVLLPALVFLRCYSICYIEQLGPDYAILSAEDPGHGFEVIMPPNQPGPTNPTDANAPPPPPPGNDQYPRTSEQ